VGIGCSTTGLVSTTPQAAEMSPRTPAGVPKCAAPSTSLTRRDREWCCRIHGVHCKSDLDILAASHTTRRTPQTRDDQYRESDCIPGSSSPDLQEWCCRERGLLCSPVRIAQPGASTTRAVMIAHLPPIHEAPMPYDCMAENADGWSSSKRTWCCEHEKRGCQASRTQYDCTHWFSVEIWTWSVGKKQWCCAHRGKGCRQGKGAKDVFGLKATTATPQAVTASTTSLQPIDDSNKPFNEMSCFDGHLQLWSGRKRAWCCQHVRRGCSELSSASSSSIFDCEEGYWNWETAWSSSKREWCCEHRQRGCEKRTTTSHLFAGISRKFEAAASRRVSGMRTTLVACAVATAAGLFVIQGCYRRRLRKLPQGAGYIIPGLWSASSSQGPLNMEMGEMSE
jgi:hypothetical protein